jgi:peptide/nickel transport system permease protein
MSATLPSRRRIRISVTGWIGLLIVAFWLVTAIAGPWLAPYPEGRVVSEDDLAPISAAFPMGTDYLGRDMLSRVLVGARYPIGISLAATVLACLAGILLALLAAARGGWVDAAVSRVLDALISIPSLMFGLVVIAALGASIPVLVLTAAVIYMPGAFRFARAMAVNINAMDFIRVARARGEGTLYIMCAEILPNMIAPVLTDFGLRFVFVVLLLSGLSFLGLGIQPPAADWGSLVRENLASLTIGVNLLIDNLPSRRAPDDVR